jgi:hypothetical protein
MVRVSLMGGILLAIVESRDGEVEVSFQGGMGTPFSTEALAAPSRTETILAGGVKNWAGL